MKLLLMFVTVIAGMATSIQASINGGLGKKVGVLEGAFISFLIGTIALFLFQLFFGKGNVLQMFSVPKWQLLGGLLGAFYVFIMVLSVPKVGVATSIIAIISGQLVMSAMIDHFGLFGGKQIPFDMKRMMGIVLLFGALFLFYKE
ncbi:DMT family transporter [Aeribacillus alveayuensis]|uniref:DMT family transporter n=1 Tax=Aeribacillus alveayuensis TaxID=279215 RepID=UPI0005D13326|nr:DMT family transporter [Bacillus alveayuensis]